MNSRYKGLRAIGTLALIVAWLTLILGILGVIGGWLGIRSILTQLGATGSGWSIMAILPGLLVALLGFFQLYIVGKVLHLLVDLDSTTLDVQKKMQTPAFTPMVGDGITDISGELKRQAKLIASNLEATQALQTQLGTLQSRLSSAPTAVAALTAPVVAAETVVARVADNTVNTVSHVAAEVIEEASA